MKILEFTCPKCGSHYFGSYGARAGGQPVTTGEVSVQDKSVLWYKLCRGESHGRACDFFCPDEEFISYCRDTNREAPDELSVSITDNNG